MPGEDIRRSMARVSHDDLERAAADLDKRERAALAEADAWLRSMSAPVQDRQESSQIEQ